MALTQDDIQGLAEELAEIYTLEAINDKIRAIIDDGGERITSWADAGVSVGRQFEITQPEMLRALRKAKLIKAGVTGGRPPAPVVYFN